MTCLLLGSPTECKLFGKERNLGFFLGTIIKGYKIKLLIELKYAKLNKYILTECINDHIRKSNGYFLIMNMLDLGLE